MVRYKQYFKYRKNDLVWTKAHMVSVILKISDFVIMVYALMV